MANCSIYECGEDSFLLEKAAREHAFGKVLDMGTGSGILAIAAAQSSKVSSVLAVDVQKGVIDYCKKNIEHPKIRFRQSDLFADINEKFDTLIFNPPYLPDDSRVSDIALDGGKHGYEVLRRFLENASDFLSPDGIMLILFSSFTKKEKIDETIKEHLLEFEQLETMHVFFEDLYVYKLKKSALLKKIEAEKISRVKYLTKGHRGFIFTGKLKGRKVTIKSKNPKSQAFGTIENEVRFLRILNKRGIGPRLILSCPDFFVYRYIDGKFIADFIETEPRAKIAAMLKSVFAQMRKMDILKIDKEEMHHPTKHVIIENGTPRLIDFERANRSQKPKNVTQFCQFLINGKATQILKKKKIFIDREKIISLAKIYKKNSSNKNFKNITDEL